MRDHEGDLRQYTFVSEAYYAESAAATRSRDIVDEVSFGFYSPDGGTSGEMVMEWINLGEQWRNGEKVIQVSPRLRCFNDAWDALAHLKDVIDALAEVDDQDISPKEFCQLPERVLSVVRALRVY